ncbi:MAG: RluA family pseudouridine synthase, partial [Clostridia bacterium]|nr:RluA family pseudouridine synthase [Clostridia bacterium]
MASSVSDRAGRLDAVLAALSGLSRAASQRLIREGAVTVDGRTAARPNQTVREGTRVAWTLPEPASVDLKAEDIPLDVTYEDADICVINKPQGMVVHPAPGHSAGTLVNGLMRHFDDLPVIGGEQRPGIVHRIDRMTSGLLVVARNDAAHLSLSEQFHAHTAGRRYIALADDNFREDSGTVSARIGRHPTDRKRMAVTERGREAVTHWAVLERFRTHTLLALRLETGRTHQIRVHMAHIRHPLSGDALYGKGEKNRLGLAGQALHGYRLTLRH